MAAPRKKSDPFVRVTLTLRKEDAEYLRHLAFAVFVASEPSTAMASLRRGERPSASMAVRFLIDERRRTQTSPTATIEREGVSHTATVGPLGDLTLAAGVRARPAVATADSLFVLPSPSPEPGPGDYADDQPDDGDDGGPAPAPALKRRARARTSPNLSPSAKRR